MASIALAIVGQTVGTAIGGPIGGTIGAAIGTAAGSYIDQAFLFPAVFGRKGQRIEGPKIDDRGLMTASEGALMNRIYGTARCSGNLFWASPLEEVQTTEESGGGKGGGGGSVKSTTYSYFRSVAIGICEGDIAKIDQVWADGKLLYQQGGFRNLLKWSDSFQQAEWVRHNCGVNFNVSSDLPPSGSGYETLHYVDRLRVANTSGQCGQKGIKVQPSTQYTFSFWCHTGQVTNPKLTIWDDTNDAYIVNQETYTPGFLSWVRVTRTFTTPADCYKLDVYVLDHCDARSTSGAFYIFGAQLEEGAVATDYDRTEAVTFATDPQYDDITFYIGSESQTVNATMEAYEGTGNVPAYRGTAFMVIKRLKLQNFGNRVPQFTFQVAEDRAKTVKQAIADICEAAGFTTYDTSAIGNGRLRGMLIEGPQVPARLLEQIMIPYGIMSQEDNGTINFFPRGEPEASDYYPIADANLGARMEGEQGRRRVVFTDVAGTELPTEVVINYIDVDNQYQKGSTRERRRIVTIPNVLSLDFPIVWGADTARTVAKRILWQAWGGRVTAQFTVGPELIFLQEGDPIRFSVGSDTYYARITEISDGANFLREIKCVVETARALRTRATSTQLITPARVPIYEPSDLDMILSDLPALREEDITGTGFYVGVALDDQTQVWRGGVVYSSLDNVLYTSLSSFSQQATMGVTTTTLAAGPEDVWDRINTVTVTIDYGSLESVSEDAVLQGQNWMLIGDEIVGFANAVLIGTKTYTLSTLIRGQRGTIAGISSHATGEAVLLLSTGLRFVSLPSSILDQIRLYKAVPIDGTLDETVAYQIFTTTGNTLRPFPPAAVTGTRDGSNNLTIDWERTTRAISSVFGPTAPVQLADELDEYEIDVMSGSTVLRTISASTNTATYSAANQTTDGLTPGNPVEINIYQLSSSIGRGVPRNITI